MNIMPILLGSGTLNESVGVDLKSLVLTPVIFGVGD